VAEALEHDVDDAGDGIGAVTAAAAPIPEYFHAPRQQLTGITFDIDDLRGRPGIGNRRVAPETIAGVLPFDPGPAVYAGPTPRSEAARTPCPFTAFCPWGKN